MSKTRKIKFSICSLELKTANSIIRFSNHLAIHRDPSKIGFVCLPLFLRTYPLTTYYLPT